MKTFGLRHQGHFLCDIFYSNSEMYLNVLYIQYSISVDKGKHPNFESRPKKLNYVASEINELSSVCLPTKHKGIFFSDSINLLRFPLYFSIQYAVLLYCTVVYCTVYKQCYTNHCL